MPTDRSTAPPGYSLARRATLARPSQGKSGRTRRAAFETSLLVLRGQLSDHLVGLDGYNSSSVEQTGTDSDCDGGTPDYYGWYEMYPADPVYFTNPVEPGDSMSASVVFDSSTSTYTLTLTDNSQGWTQTEQEQESGLANSSAEVITEAPSSESGPLPLADFGTVDYSGSTVNGSSMDAQNPTQIIMVGSSGDQLDSTSSMDGAGDFSNTWLAES